MTLSNNIENCPHLSPLFALAWITLCTVGRYTLWSCIQIFIPMQFHEIFIKLSNLKKVKSQSYDFLMNLKDIEQTVTIATKRTLIEAKQNGTNHEVIFLQTSCLVNSTYWQKCPRQQNLKWECHMQFYRQLYRKFDKISNFVQVSGLLVRQSAFRIELIMWNQGKTTVQCTQARKH